MVIMLSVAVVGLVAASSSSTGSSYVARIGQTGR